MTASNPEDQLDSRRRGTSASEAGKRARTAGPTSSQGQRIFVSGDRIVEKPPVLFKMPSVKLAHANQGQAAEPPVQAENGTEIGSKAKDIDNPVASARADRGLSNDSISESGSKNHSGTHGVRAPHFLKNSANSSSTSASTGAPSLPDQEDAKQDVPGGSVQNPAETLRFDDSTTGGRFKASSQSSPTTESQTNSENERNVETERNTSRTPKSQRPLPPVPEVAPVPAGRSWMEVLGSRMMILLLVAAIGAIAFLANRESTPRSAAELAILELGDTDGNPAAADAVSKRAEAKLENDTHAHVAKPLQGTTGSVNNSSNLTNQIRTAKSSPSVDVDTPTTPNANSQSTTQAGVESVEPEFDLSELLATESSATKKTDSTLNPPSLSAPSNVSSVEETDELTDKPAAQQDWQRDLEEMGAEMGVAPERKAMTASSERPAYQMEGDAGAQWVREPAATASNSPSVSNGFNTALRGSQTGAIGQSDQAINAAINAARVDREREDAASANAGSAIMSTAQPAGVADWTRYLPGNPNAGNSNMQQPTGTYQGYQPSQNFGPSANGQGAPQQMVPGNYQPGMYQPGMYPQGNQPNLMPPGMINPSRDTQQNYPNQSFSTTQTYGSSNTAGDSPYNGQAMVPAGQNYYQNYGQPSTAMLPGSSNVNGTNGGYVPNTNGTSNANGYPSNYYPANSNPTTTGGDSSLR